VGEFPQGLPAESLTLPLPDPVSGWAEALENALRREGIEFKGRVEIEWRRVAPDAASDRARLLAEHKSPPLAAIIERTNKDSDNHLAEMVYLAAGGRAAGQCSYDASHAAEARFLRGMRIPDSLVEGEDGSGLARTDLVAPRAIVMLLREMASGAGSEAFRASLPVSGRDGTLRYRMSKDGMEGQVTAKTGTLRDVSGLSGYIKGRDGREIAFSILANHFSSPVATIRATQDRICGILVRSSGRD
jgi:D-alanyl-D-alanine carboxypeptidase/D-alanyl-D-alanine-endopeptidase (penicillin-binding protein 4)